MEKLLSQIIMKLLKLRLKMHQRKYPTHELIYITGTEKDYPGLVVYSASEGWTYELLELVEGR